MNVFLFLATTPAELDFLNQSRPIHSLGATRKSLPCTEPVHTPFTMFQTSLLCETRPTGSPKHSGRPGWGYWMSSVLLDLSIPICKVEKRLETWWREVSSLWILITGNNGTSSMFTQSQALLWLFPSLCQMPLIAAPPSSPPTSLPLHHHCPLPHLCSSLADPHPGRLTIPGKPQETTFL